MGVTASTAEQISVGAGDAFYKNGLGVWVPVGATKDINVFRVNTTYATIKLNNVVSPLKGVDYITEQLAELEVTGVELDAEKIALMVPGAASTAETANDISGLVTTLADDTEAGDTDAIKLTSVTTVIVGDTIRIGADDFVEYRTVTRVGTAGSGGTGIDVDFPLQAAHAAGDEVHSTDGTGLTIITPPTARRLPSSAYHDWRLDVPGLDGRMVRFYVFDGIMSGPADFSADDANAMGPRLMLQSRIDPAQPNRGGWKIEKVPAFGADALGS